MKTFSVVVTETVTTVYTVTADDAKTAESRTHEIHCGNEEGEPDDLTIESREITAVEQEN